MSTSTLETPRWLLKLAAILLTLALTLVTGFGCATKPPPLSEPEPEPQPHFVPPPTNLMPRSVSIPDDEPRPAGLRLLEETRFTLDVQDMALDGLLLGLGHDGPFNVVVDPGVTGKVSVNFSDASLREILDQLLEPRGYRYTVRGNFLRISASDRNTRTYRVDYPNYARRGNSDLTISGAISSKVDIGASGGESGEDKSATSIQTTQEVDFWTELESGVRAIVHGTSGEEAPADSTRSVVIARQSGILTITAEPEILDDVEDFIREIARSTERQVLIDVRIVEVDLGDDFDFGVDWEAALDLGQAEGTLTRAIIPGTKDASIVSNLAPALTGGGFIFSVAAEEVGVLLTALASERNVKVVSTPRLATLNNHKALIKVVRNEVFFIAEVKTEVVEAVGTTQTVEFVPQLVPVGVTLDITPQISGDGEITMHLHPSVSEVVDIVIQPQSDPDLDQFGTLPVIDLRETDTVMRVKDQTTILIGGLIQSRELFREEKIPLLGDIPFLGQLFRTTDTEESRTELVIFVTPTILDAPMITRVREEAEESLNELDDLRQKRAQWPWWRVPYFDSYGLETTDGKP